MGARVGIFPHRRRTGKRLSPNLLDSQSAQAISTSRTGWGSSCRWRREPRWRLAQASGFRGRVLLAKPIADARSGSHGFRRGGPAAAVSPRDGHFVAFPGAGRQMDVWITQIARTVPQLDRGARRARQSVAPHPRLLARWLSFVTHWVRKQDGSSGGGIGICGTRSGGQPRPYLEGAAARLVARRPRLASPPPDRETRFRLGRRRRPPGRPSSPRRAGSTVTSPLWGADAAFIYLSRAPPGQIGYRRIAPAGGTPRTDHVAQRAREPSGPVGSANA